MTAFARLFEWSGRVLSLDEGYGLDSEGRRVAAHLTENGIVEILPLDSGILVRTNSHVGRIDLGGFILDIRPKLPGLRLAQLLWYTYGMDDLKLQGRAWLDLDEVTFFDLLIYSLLAHAEKIMRRGFVKAYVHRREELTAIRGRIDMGRVAAQGGVLSEKIPCAHHRREDDTHLNRVLLAGIRLAGDMAVDGGLRHDAQKTAAILAESVSEILLTKQTLDTATRGLNRLNEEYTPALELITLLYDKDTPSLDGEAGAREIPGFFFDMNRFFEKLVGKLLKTLPEEYTVEEQLSLRNLVGYNPTYNPKGRKPLLPRPDFILKKNGIPERILDAKYRDLWEHNLPRDMLYQLAVYSLSGLCQEDVTILYPTLGDEASLQVIDIQAPQAGDRIGGIVMLPINLNKIGAMLERAGHYTLAKYIHDVVILSRSGSTGHLY